MREELDMLIGNSMNHHTLEQKGATVFAEENTSPPPDRFPPPHQQETSLLPYLAACADMQNTTLTLSILSS